MYVVIKAQIFRPVCEAMKTRNEALTAAALNSSFALTNDVTLDGGIARFLRAGGALEMRYSCSALYSFSLIV